MAESLRIQKPERFPSVIVGNIFLHLRQSKFYWHLYRGILPEGRTCCFSTRTIHFQELRSAGSGRDGYTVRKEAKITLPEETSVKIRLPDTRRLSHLFFFFLQGKIDWISILFLVPLLSLLIFSVSH